jgi:hypothetical protein
MKNIYIEKWFCRLGNNIIQVINVILIALYYNYNIILPKNKYFNTTYIIINDKITMENEKIISSESENFFFRDRIKDIDKKLFKLNNERTLEILKKSFNFNNFKLHDLKNNDIVIHIRSGDIFSRPNPHPHYIMPPLSYYIDIIKFIKYDNTIDDPVIYLISEDTLNPCVNELLKLYPQIIYKKQSLDEDISLILSAHNIIASFGSFISALLHFSQNIKNLHKVSYDKYDWEIYKNLNFYITDLNEYHELMKPWKNTEEQKRIMINYQCKNIIYNNDKLS